MTTLFVTAIEKIAVALLPLILKWIGDEALALITHRVQAETTIRATAAEAKAEAVAPSDRDGLIQSLQKGNF